MEYLTIQELVETAEKKKMSIGAVVLEDQAVQMEQSKNCSPRWRRIFVSWKKQWRVEWIQNFGLLPD